MEDCETCYVVEEEDVVVKDNDPWYGDITTGITRYHLSCGHTVYSRNWDEPRYCSECGAMVVCV